MDARQARSIPFKYHGNSIRPDLNNVRRLAIYRSFIGSDTLATFSLATGEKGYISEGLKIKDNTLSTDFNFTLIAPSRNYHDVTCFEVLNHVMNPLNLMIGVHGLLAPGGRVFLSVPKLWLIPWHHCKHNFAMYSPDRLDVLFDYAGFTVVRRKTYNPWPLRFMFYGVRPFFRVLFNRIEVWELRKR